MLENFATAGRLHHNVHIFSRAACTKPGWYYHAYLVPVKPLFHLSQKPTRKLAASAFKYCNQWMKVLAASFVLDLSLFPTHRAKVNSQRVLSNIDCMKVLAANLRVGFCDEWKRAYRPSAHKDSIPNVFNMLQYESRRDRILWVTV